MKSPYLILFIEERIEWRKKYRKMFYTIVLHHKQKNLRNPYLVSVPEILSCGEYRSRTDDLLHAMQAL